MNQAEIIDKRYIALFIILPLAFYVISRLSKKPTRGHPDMTFARFFGWLFAISYLFGGMLVGAIAESNVPIEHNWVSTAAFGPDGGAFPARKFHFEAFLLNTFFYYATVSLGICIIRHLERVVTGKELPAIMD